MKKEDAKSQLPRYLRDKYAQGKKVFQSELDEAYFKMMKQRRRGVSIIDIINTINKGLHCFCVCFLILGEPFISLTKNSS